MAAETLEELEAELADAKAQLATARRLRAGGHSDVTYTYQRVRDLREEVELLVEKIDRMSRPIGLTR